MKSLLSWKICAIAVCLGAGITLSRLHAADHDADQQKTLKGEIVDLMCYLDHGAKGDGHKGCAGKCLKSGGPVGLLVGDQVYLVVGDHKPMNDELAGKAAETVTLKGKVVEKSGMKMIENSQIVE